MSTAAELYDDLVRWVRAGGGKLHGAVELYQDEHAGAAFRVRQGSSLEPGDVIAETPLAKSLSYLNAVHGHDDSPTASHPVFRRPENSPPFPAAFLNGTSPHVVQRFFLVQQYLLGEESAWWPYVRSLPQPEQLAGLLPAVWARDDVRCLGGTDLYDAVQGIKSALKKEYRQAMELLPGPFARDYTRPLYLWAYCVFTSRSFRPSLVLPAGAAPALPCGLDDLSILLPLWDVGNHSPRARVAWTSDADTHVCRLETAQAYAGGSQVYNNYGMKTNAELLLGYGFMLPETADFHNDYVHVRTRGGGGGEGELAHTHVVSLRPLTDPSSVVGRARQRSAESASISSGRFSHFQDSLVASLSASIQQNLDPGHEGEGGGESAGIEATPDAIRRELARVLTAKLSHDLHELESLEIHLASGDDCTGADADGLGASLEHLDEIEGISEPARLALRYRQQCRMVLRNALACLATSSD